MATIKVTQVRSSIGREKSQKRTLEALGIRKMGGTVEHEATAPIIGMVKKVLHLVKVEGELVVSDKPAAKKEKPAAKKTEAKAEKPAAKKAEKATEKPAAKKAEKKVEAKADAPAEIEAEVPAETKNEE